MNAMLSARDDRLCIRSVWGVADMRGSRSGNSPRLVNAGPAPDLLHRTRILLRSVRMKLTFPKVRYGVLAALALTLTACGGGGGASGNDEGDAGADATSTSPSDKETEANFSPGR